MRIGGESLITGQHMPKFDGKGAWVNLEDHVSLTNNDGDACHDDISEALSGIKAETADPSCPTTGHPSHATLLPTWSQTRVYPPV